MTTREVLLRRGKAGEVQHFSLARPLDPVTIALLQETLSSEVSDDRRAQILSDPTKVFQFLGVFGQYFGFFTRPLYVPHNGDTVVVGNLTDTIGEPLPVRVSTDDFRGFFTTLVTRRDAVEFGLTIHPTAPDTVRGRAGDRRDPVEASLERLQFPVPDEPEDLDYPVIVALPCFLPAGPGQSVPHYVTLTSDVDLGDTFPLANVWRKGYQYAIQFNGGRSVTAGGPLFHLDDLEPEAGQPGAFANYTVVETLPARPLTPLLPHHALYPAARQSLLAWSDTIWVELGGNMAPEQPPPANPAGVGFTPDHLRAVMEPLVNRDRVFSSADRSMSRYRLLLAAAPPTGEGNQDHVVLPDLRDEFKAYLSVSSSATAAQDLRELVKSKISIANHSNTCLDKDVTLEPENITLAFSDRLRTFTWLSEKLVSTSKVGAQASLGLLQFLTPDRDALALVAEGDQEAATLLMSNSTSSTAQLDASKASKLYCSGRLTSFRHSYEAICNLRCLFSAMVEHLDQPMVIVKVLAYVDLLVDRQGRLFFEAYKNSPYLAIHPWQDLQSILSAFIRVATDSTIYGPAGRNEPISIQNYQSAMALADSLTSDLRAILNGNGLGKFEGTPSCATWFVAPKTPAGGRLPSEPTRGNDPAAKRPKLDAADVERKKSLGILVLDAAAAGSTRLPNCDVRFKKRGAKTPERLCMKFLTKGYYCPYDTDCRLPHLTNINALSDGEKTKFLDFVKKQPGLSWVEGKAPTGTV